MAMGQRGSLFLVGVALTIGGCIRASGSYCADSSGCEVGEICVHHVCVESDKTTVVTQDGAPGATPDGGAADGGLDPDPQDGPWITALPGALPYGPDEAIAVDASGNVYLVGTLIGERTFGAYHLTAASDDIFLVKFAPNGQIQWAVSAGGADSDAAKGIAVDAAGNVYIVGRFSGTATFGSGANAQSLTSQGHWDAFVVKYSSAGTVLWARSAGGLSADTADDVAVDELGHVYVTGTYVSDATFGAVPNLYTLAHSTNDNPDVFLAQYDSQGNFLWAISAATTGSDAPARVAADGSGNVLLNGRFRQTMHVRSGTTTHSLTSRGYDDIYLAKFDSTGTTKWVKGIGTFGIEQHAHVAASASGSVYLAGFTGSSEISFDGLTVACPGMQSIFFVKYQSNGSPIWAQCLDGTAYDYPAGLAVDGSDNVYLAGNVESAADWGTPKGGTDVLFAKFNPEGETQWTQLVGGAANDTGSHLAVNPAGTAYLVGRYRGTVTLGSTTLATATSAAELFLWKITGDGL